MYRMGKISARESSRGGVSRFFHFFFLLQSLLHGFVSRRFRRRGRRGGAFYFFRLVACRQRACHPHQIRVGGVPVRACLCFRGAEAREKAAEHSRSRRARVFCRFSHRQKRKVISPLSSLAPQCKRQAERPGCVSRRI